MIFDFDPYNSRCILLKFNDRNTLIAVSMNHALHIVEFEFRSWTMMEYINMFRTSELVIVVNHIKFC